MYAFNFHSSCKVSAIQCVTVHPGHPQKKRSEGLEGLNQIKKENKGHFGFALKTIKSHVTSCSLAWTHFPGVELTI